MSVWIRGIAAVLLGVIIGSAVNMAIVINGPVFIPLPEGIDPADTNSLVENMHRFGPEHFVAPWLAHALGTLIGALVAALIAASHPMRFGLGVGAFFLSGGIANALMLPAPIGFIAVDLLGAYLPMAWLGVRGAAAIKSAATDQGP